MTRFSDLSSHYRLYGVGASPRWVARDLQQHFSPYALVREKRGRDLGFYVLDVDDDLLRILARTGVSKLGDVLPKLQQTTNHFGRQFSSKAITSSFRARKAPGALTSMINAIGRASAEHPHVIIDSLGTAIAMRAEAAAPPETASLYPHLDGPRQVEPGAIAEFSLRLDALPLAGSGTMLQVTFPEGAQTLTINARVSTAEFSLPAGETWGKEFTVDRDLKVTPETWSIKACALGDRKQFTLAVIFNAAGMPLGSVTQTVPRKGTSSDNSPKQSANTMVLPQSSGADIVLELARQSVGYMVSVYEKGHLACGPATWELTGQDFFDALQSATTAEALDEVANAIAIEMDDAITALLDRNDLEGITTLIISDQRVAPFEAMKLRRSQNGPLLGADRPVVRWISKAGMALSPSGRKIACIRPNYPGRSALPSAKQEEEDLQLRYPQMSVVRTSAEFSQLLKSSDIGMVHYAGHARGNPPYLILEDSPVSAMKFSSTSELMRTGHPVIFANGCRAGQSQTGVPAMQANFAKIVLKSGASGFIAPMIEVDSPAAYECEKTFYRALEKHSVAEAIQQVRALATTCAAPQKATCVSYAAFVSPDLHLQLI